MLDEETKKKIADEFKAGLSASFNRYTVHILDCVLDVINKVIAEPVRRGGGPPKDVRIKEHVEELRQSYADDLTPKVVKTERELDHTMAKLVFADEIINRLISRGWVKHMLVDGNGDWTFSWTHERYGESVSFPTLLAYEQSCIARSFAGMQIDEKAKKMRLVGDDGTVLAEFDLKDLEMSHGL